MPGSGDVGLLGGVRPAWPMMGGIHLLGSVFSGFITESDTHLDDSRMPSLTNSENSVVFKRHGDDVTELGAPGEVDG